MASSIVQCNHTPYILVDDISDHMPILVQFRNQNKSMKGLKTVKHRNLDHSAIDKINQDISAEDWSLLLSNLDVNDSFNLFHQTLTTSIDKHAPEKTLKLGRKSLIRDPWITNGILRSLR